MRRFASGEEGPGEGKEFQVEGIRAWRKVLKATDKRTVQSKPS